MMQTIDQAVSFCAYPGRGVLLGLTQQGDEAFFAYFIMGRSENSRNRIFVEDGDGIRTQAFDPAKLKDPSLIIYAPVRVLGNTTIVTNGDQTDTIYDFLAQGKNWEEALYTREFEPDAPNYTPRISGKAVIENGRLAYSLSILKRGGDGGCIREFYDYPQPIAGEGRLIHTYQTDGDPLPSFQGAPRPVGLQGSVGDMAKVLWESLDADNKVSLFVRGVSLTSGDTTTYLFNKNR